MFERKGALLKGGVETNLRHVSLAPGLRSRAGISTGDAGEGAEDRAGREMALGLRCVFLLVR